jgi:hypothetical protein
MDEAERARLLRNARQADDVRPVLLPVVEVGEASGADASHGYGGSLRRRGALQAQQLVVESRSRKARDGLLMGVFDQVRAQPSRAVTYVMRARQLLKHLDL